MRRRLFLDDYPIIRLMNAFPAHLSGKSDPTHRAGEGDYQESLDFEVFETEDGLVRWQRLLHGHGRRVLEWWSGVLRGGVLGVHLG